jgi:hypothetical protein
MFRLSTDPGSHPTRNNVLSAHAAVDNAPSTRGPSVERYRAETLLLLLQQRKVYVAFQ